MRGVECICDLNRQTEQDIALERFSGDAMLQRQSVQKLHGDEALTLSLVNLEDHANVGMVQGGSSLRFTLTTGKSLGVFGYFIGQEFQ